MLPPVLIVETQNRLHEALQVEVVPLFRVAVGLKRNEAHPFNGLPIEASDRWNVLCETADEIAGRIVVGDDENLSRTVLGDSDAELAAVAPDDLGEVARLEGAWLLAEHVVDALAVPALRRLPPLHHHVRNRAPRAENVLAVRRVAAMTGSAPGSNDLIKQRNEQTETLRK